MDKNYIKYKLQDKITRHYRNSGFQEIPCDLSFLVDKVNEVGDYKIIWTDNTPRDIVIFDFSHTVKVEGGKYYILNKTGDFRQQLFSSEFIQFNLKEMREYKLNKILKEK